MQPNVKPSIALLPLEPYQARYTELLHKWELSAFSRHFDVTQLFPGGSIPVPFSLTTGEVLDSVRRPVWALEQTRDLVPRLQQFDAVYVSDFFHPGIEAIAYAGKKQFVGAFCWAQTFDRHDFTRRMISWMRPYETMAAEIYDAIYVASDLLSDLMVSAMPWLESKVVVVGNLPFNSEDCLMQLPGPPGKERPYDVVYSSRLDLEKNPRLFLEVVKARKDLKFLVCTGHPELKGTDIETVRQLKLLATAGSNLTVACNLTKPEYFNLLTQSKVQLNTSKQDWVSFTLLEALTFGCLPLYPLHRSFVEVFKSDTGFTYVPESAADIISRLDQLLAISRKGHLGTSYPNMSGLLSHADSTLDSIANHIASSLLP